jgi:hypothetical protein
VDLKTLEYMEQRTKLARVIVTRIEELKKQMSDLKRARGTIDLYNPGHPIRLEVKPYNEKSVNNYETYAVAVLQNTFIDLSTSEIRRLEEELAKL